MLKFISSYVLAKQVHFDVKLLYEGREIPSDAAAVFIPGIKLSGNSKDVIQRYLVNGGKVYQSYENDFGTSISIGSDTIINNATLSINSRTGLMSDGEQMMISGQIKMHRTSGNQNANTHVSLLPGSDLSNSRSDRNNAIFISQSVGKGTFYYLAYDLEAGLSKIYNPWSTTNCELFYSALKPQTSIDIDNKYVELYVKKNSDKRILILLNHSEAYQNVTVKSINSLKLINIESKESIGEGKEITLTLRPAQVVIMNVQNQALEF
jgi:hypothetical protein